MIVCEYFFKEFYSRGSNGFTVSTKEKKCA